MEREGYAERERVTEEGWSLLEKLIKNRPGLNFNGLNAECNK